MRLAFKSKEIELADPVILSTASGDDSMPYVVGRPGWLEANGAIINDQGWKASSFEN
jgi:hypothetical protein